MDRVKPGYSAVIEAAYNRIPEPLHRLIRPHFLTGTDPVFAGLHSYRYTNDGRSYEDTAHAVYDYHQEHLSRAERRVTVVLPVVPSVATVVHEMGHVLHQRIGFDFVTKPVTRYAQNNHHEAFAEAFSAWRLPEWYPLRPEDKALALFEALADGG
jgi:hypothetical protein